MRTATRWFGLVAMLFVLLGVPALATPARGGASATPKAHGPKTTTLKATTTGAPVKSSTAKVKGSSAAPKATATSKGATTKFAKSTTPKGTSASAKTKGGTTTPTSTQSGTTTTASNTTSGSTTTSSGGTGSTPSTGTWTPDNAVAQKLSTKSNILRKVQNSLGTNVDLNNATAGFKNFGQFVAAVNVSNNHNIEFADLKAAMTGINIDGEPLTTPPGTTAVTTMSLGQAIQKLKTGVDADTVAQNALTQANVEINSSPTTTSTTSSASSTSTSTSTTTTKAKSK